MQKPSLSTKQHTATKPAAFQCSIPCCRLQLQESKQACQDLQEQLDLAQATLDQKEHDMLLVSRGRSLLGVCILSIFLLQHLLVTQEAIDVDGLLHSWVGALHGPARPSNRLLQFGPTS